jgi:hypothetical protein
MVFNASAMLCVLYYITSRSYLWFVIFAIRRSQLFHQAGCNRGYASFSDQSSFGFGYGVGIGIHTSPHDRPLRGRGGGCGRTGAGASPGGGKMLGGTMGAMSAAPRALTPAKSPNPRWVRGLDSKSVHRSIAGFPESIFREALGLQSKT